jgi:hypothetical protein
LRGIKDNFFASQKETSPMKTEQSPGGQSGLAEILLSTITVLVAMAVLLFPSYSGLYG